MLLKYCNIFKVKDNFKMYSITLKNVIQFF